MLLLKDDLGVIQGMGVISYRMGYIKGELQMIGYLGNLRVKMNRKLIRKWRQMYAQLIRLSSQMKETHFCRYYQTVLIDENKESKNNLAETKIPNLHYHRLQKYKMVNIIGRVKLQFAFSYVRFATNENLSLIGHFLATQNPKDFFSHDWDAELSHRLKNWNEFHCENILLAFNKKGELAGISSLWNPLKSKQIRITKIPSFLSLLYSVGGKIPFLEFKKLPQENTPLDILYLTQPIFKAELSRDERKKIIHDFIHFSFHKNFHMLAYADFENEGYLEGVSTFLMQKMPMALLHCSLQK